MLARHPYPLEKPSVIMSKESVLLSSPAGGSPGSEISAKELAALDELELEDIVKNSLLIMSAGIGCSGTDVRDLDLSGADIFDLNSIENLKIDSDIGDRGCSWEESPSQTDLKYNGDGKIFQNDASSADLSKENDLLGGLCSSENILTDITAAVIGASSPFRNPLDDKEISSPSSGASKTTPPKKNLSSEDNDRTINGAQAPEDFLGFGSDFSQHTNPSIDLIDLGQLSEYSEKLSPSNNGSASVPLSEKSLETLLDLEEGDVAEEESRLFTLHYNEDSKDSLEELPYDSILIEKGKRGRPCRKPVMKPAKYAHILPKTTLPSSGHLTSGHNIPVIQPSFVCFRTSESSASVSSLSRDGSNSDKDSPHQLIIIPNSVVSSGAQRPPSDIDESFPKMIDSRHFSNKPCHYFDSQQYFPPERCQAPPQREPMSQPSSQPFSNGHFINSLSYPLCSEQFHTNILQPVTESRVYHPGPSHNQSHLHEARLVQQSQHGAPCIVPSLQHHGQGAALINQVMQSGGALHPKGMFTNQSHSATGGFDQSSTRMALGHAPCGQLGPSLVHNGTAGFLHNVYNGEVNIRSDHNPCMRPGENTNPEMVHLSPPSNDASYHASFGANRFATCSRIKISSNPTVPNEKPHLNLPSAGKQQLVSNWIQTNIPDVPPESGYYPANDRSLVPDLPCPNSYEVQKASGACAKMFCQSEYKFEAPYHLELPTSKNSEASMSSIKAVCRKQGANHMSASPMQFTPAGSEHLNFYEMLNQPFPGSLLPFVPPVDVEKAIADREIENNICKIKDNSLEKRQCGHVISLEMKQSSWGDYFPTDNPYPTGDPLQSGASIQCLEVVQLSYPTSFDRSQYLTSKEISSYEAKRQQSGKTSLDDYLNLPPPTSNSVESIQTPHGHKCFEGIKQLPTPNIASHLEGSLNGGISPHRPKTVKRSSEDSKPPGLPSHLGPLPGSSARKTNGSVPSTNNTLPHVSNTRKTYVTEWLRQLPFENNAHHQHTFAVAPVTTAPEPSLSSKDQMWPASTLPPPALSISDASMLSETRMSIENQNTYPTAVRNSSSSMEVVDSVSISVTNGLNSHFPCSAPEDHKQATDEMLFNEVMKFLTQDISNESHDRNSGIKTNPTPKGFNVDMNGISPCPRAQVNNAASYGAQATLCPTLTDVVPNFSHYNPSLQPNLSSQNTIPMYARSHLYPNDDSCLSPRGPHGGSVTKHQGKLAMPSLNDQQPSDHVSSLDSSKLSGDSDLSKYSSSSIPDQMMGPDRDGETCLHFLCDMPLESMPEIKGQPGFREALDLQNKKRETALFIAVKRQNASVTEFLLSSGANPNIICTSHVQGLGTIQHSALHQAVMTGNLPIIRLLLSSKNIMVDAKASYGGQTPLMLAMSLHRPDKSKDVIMLLIEKRASFKLQEIQGRTPLMLAIQSKDVSLVENILSLVGPVTARTLVTASDKKGLTCLHIAAGLPLNTQEKKRLLQCIITAGGDASVKNAEGETPRDWAKNEINDVLQNLGRVNKS